MNTANAQLIKQFIDEQYANPDLNVEVISRRFSYHKKYVSSLFKRQFGMGVAEYINTIRINHACALIDKGECGVSEISAAVGFRDALYFSKVFKSRLGVSPRVYMENVRKESGGS